MLGLTVNNWINIIFLTPNPFFRERLDTAFSIVGGILINIRDSIASTDIC